MKVELHLHTSRYSACAVDPPTDMMRKLIACGYGAVFLTEHDAVWPEREIAELQARFPEIRIFGGVELSVGDSWTMQHLLVLGTSDRAYLTLSGAGGSDVPEILARARRGGHLTVLAHPYRWGGGDGLLRRGLLPDALECRTCNQDARQAELARQAAAAVSLPVVNAGDVHSVEMIGRCWIETAKPVEEAQDIRRIVQGGQYLNRVIEDQRL